MSNTQITYLVAAIAGSGSVVAWFTLIVVPAWTSYTRLWQRTAAMVLSVYVLAAFLMLGAGVAAAILYYYDEI